MTKLSKAQSDKLAEISSMTHNSQQGFSYMTPKGVQLLVDAGLVECNNSMTDGNKVAVRVTNQGDEWLKADEAPPVEGTDNMDNQTPAPAFAIDDDVSIPAIKRKGSSTSVYPFAALEIGQSFFVPATEAMPTPGKSLASTVSSASKRYATANGTRTINRRLALVNEDGTPMLGADGKRMRGELEAVQVPAYHYERKFKVRSVEENGVPGARVWRVKVEEEVAGDE
jgi:hypothetical protein